MTEINLDQYKESWKKDNEKRTLGKRISEDDIRSYLSMKTKDITVLYQKGLWFDIVLKSILIFSFGFLIWIFKSQAYMLIINLALIILTIYLIILQRKYFGKIPKAHNTDDNLKNVLKRKIDFFNQTYIKALYVGAATNPLLILSGMMFYMYFKYGEIRPFEIDDYIVLGGMILISYFFALLIQVKQFRFHINQLETCLQEFSQDTLDELSIKRQRNQRMRIWLVSVILVVFGVLLFFYLMSI